mmetsp:Transcript_39225/g.104114  ORF Transcript_39225/g.104114 Transcript_39225/m.104114 type:complete len:200 (+) Transcript_39225:428-1027(+)
MAKFMVGLVRNIRLPPRRLSPIPCRPFRPAMLTCPFRFGGKLFFFERHLTRAIGLATSGRPHVTMKSHLPSVAFTSVQSWIVLLHRYHVAVRGASHVRNVDTVIFDESRSSLGVKERSAGTGASSASIAVISDDSDWWCRRLGCSQSRCVLLSNVFLEVMIRSEELQALGALAGASGHFRNVLLVSDSVVVFVRLPKWR